MTLRNVIKKIASIIYFPLFMKRGFLIVAGSTLLSPFASFLFPTAQEALRKNGLRESIAEELAPGEKIHVEEGVAGVLLSAPFFPVINIAQAYSSPNSTTASRKIIWNLANSCVVNMQVPDHFTVNEYISTVSGIPITEIKNSPVSHQERRAVILLHEIRHCGQDMANMSDYAIEGDADYHAATVAAQEFKNPEIIRWRFNMRAAHKPMEDGHDMALYLDAVIKRENPPDKDQIKDANKNAKKFINDMRTDSASLSPLALKRVRFYNEGRRYFMTAPKR